MEIPNINRVFATDIDEKISQFITNFGFNKRILKDHRFKKINNIELSLT